MPDFAFENAVRDKAVNARFFSDDKLSDLIVGVDEAGCGPWAGPVVAGAVAFFNHNQLPSCLENLLDDSKSLTKLKRDKAFSALTGMTPGDLVVNHSANTFIINESCEPTKETLWIWGIGVAQVCEIDLLNIRQATLLAMKRAVESLNIQPAHGLVDGISKPDLSCPVTTIKKGDTLSYSIAAASILAKVYRDCLMADLSKLFPLYGWAKNAGYGTKAHQSALDQQGVTPHHRKSFKPIAMRLAQ